MSTKKMQCIRSPKKTENQRAKITIRFSWELIKNIFISESSLYLIIHQLK